MRRLALDPLHARLAIRATVAAAAAFLLTDVFALPKGYWAVLTAVLVVQSNIGATIGATLDRALGTLLGGVVGVAGAVLSGPSFWLTATVLAVAILGTAYFAALYPSLKLAPVTVIIVLLSDPTHADPVASALERVAEISIGCGVGFAAALLVLPSRAVDHLREEAARALESCGRLLELASGRLLGGALAGAEVDALNSRIRQSLRAGDARLGEARREQAGHLAERADPAPIIRSLRRLWHSEIILLRAAAEALPEVLLKALGEPLAAARDEMLQEIRRLAAALTGGPAESAPPASAVTVLESRIEALRGSDVLRSLDARRLSQLFAVGFAFEQVASNLADLAERLHEQAPRRAAHQVPPPP